MAAPRQAGTRRWLVLAIAMFVLGSAAAAGAAERVGQRDAERAQQAFAVTAAEVASALQLALRHEDDLVLSAQAFAVSQPRLTQSQFVHWTEAIQALNRYPELASLGVVTVVSAAQLPGALERMRADPVVPGSSVELTPPGNRPYYCLNVAGLARGTQPTTMPGQDYCGEPYTSMAAMVRDSGEGFYTPDVAGRASVLTVLTPVYSRGVSPPTVQERRRTFRGFVGLRLSPTQLLAHATQGHPHTGISLRFQQGASDVTYGSAVVRPGASTIRTDLHNGWTLITSSAQLQQKPWASRSARGLLVAGVVVTALLAGLVFVLGTGRRRALALAERKTAQIQHMALHDQLTGLPNRALILDRIEHELTRAQCTDSAVGLLFLDLDGFKDVNDTYGHGAGDQLLQHVARCLRGALRGEDVVGRLGGDEFVVLIDGPCTVERAEQVAERVHAALATPLRLPGAEAHFVIARASLGAAVGLRPDAVELLRDADVALYEAKRSGKGRCVVFTPELQAAT